MLLAASRGEARDLVSATPVAKRASIPAGKAKRIQCDEIWSFCYSKQKNVATAKRQDLAYGDVWTWTGLDADSKLIGSWMVGGSGSDHAIGSLDAPRARLADRVQRT